MTPDQIAQLDLIIARISFYKAAAQVFQDCLNQEWPGGGDLVGIDKEVHTLLSFQCVVQVFGEFYLSKAINLELELNNKRRQFEETGKGLTK